MNLNHTHIRSNHTASLHTHVIQRRRHRPRPHGPRIPTRNRHDDRMHVRRPNQERAQSPLDPRPRVRRDRLERNQDRERPELAHETDEEALVRLLRDPGPEEQLQDEEHVGGYGEQIRLKGAEAGGLELQRQVLRHGIVGDEPGEAKQVNRPHVVVAQAVPERLGGERLPVMHIALAGVITQDAIHHNELLALGEPAILAAEAARGLSGRGRQVEEGDEADAAGQHALEGEEPAPAREAVVAAQVEDAEGEESGDDARALVRDPEEAEADRQLEASVEIAEVEDIVRDEAALEHAEQGAAFMFSESASLISETSLSCETCLGSKLLLQGVSRLLKRYDRKTFASKE